MVKDEEDKRRGKKKKERGQMRCYGDPVLLDYLTFVYHHKMYLCQIVL